VKSFTRYLRIAAAAAKLAGDFLRDSYGPIKEMHRKSGTHHGIEDDKRCAEIYTEYLENETPEVARYMEDGDQNLDSALVWVVDPIDGTSNYRVGIPLFVTQICLLYRGEPVISVIRAPMFDQVFSARKNHGAYLNGTKISVSKTARMDKAMLGVNKGSSNRDTGRYITRLGPLVRTIRIYGAMGLDLAYLACGRLDALINSGSQLYDYVPGVLLVREAGGIAANFTGARWTCADRTLAAANKSLLAPILSELGGGPRHARKTA